MNEFYLHPFNIFIDKSYQNFIFLRKFILNCIISSLEYFDKAMRVFQKKIEHKEMKDNALIRLRILGRKLE